MKRRSILLGLTVLLAGSITSATAAIENNLDAASDYLSTVMDQYHTALYVYDDFSSPGNHFIERARICQPGDEAALPVMDECWEENPRSGNSCIKCTFESSKWGGWMFMNGVYLPNAEKPSLNWGTQPNAGVDLSGATKLTFWARGDQGGERVQFYCFGIGRHNVSGRAMQPYPDSSEKKYTQYLTLTREWKKYVLDISTCDLTNTLLGFAWSTKASINSHQPITFYVDDVAFNLDRRHHPRFIRSYQTIQSDDEIDDILANTAYMYDNAATVLAFLSTGRIKRAKLIADAIVYAQNHDRYFDDGRIRNAYQAGDLRLPNGWTPTGHRQSTRLPGWWEKNSKCWSEDSVSAGTYAGNMAWAMLALISTYEATGEKYYMRSAIKMGRWIIDHCYNENGGFTAGYEGWGEEQVRLGYKSTEHNVDIYAVFKRLHEMTRKEIWNRYAQHALIFVKSMWDYEEGKFWTGTTDDGITPFRDIIPIDVQTWSILALQDEGRYFRKGLEYAERHMAVGRGYDFNEDEDGIWFEGTAQMAAVYGQVGQSAKARVILDFMRTSQDHSGGFFASDEEAISTGFYAGSEEWLYYKRLHIGATAWFILAATNSNPFWMEPSMPSMLVQNKSNGKPANGWTN